MATLADAAASAVGGNNLPGARGAYFHDIGKLVKPEYFIENQDALQNRTTMFPSMSRLIIVST